MNQLPNFDKTAKFLIILFIISILINFLISDTLALVLSHKEIVRYNAQLHISSVIQIILSISINIFMGIWLYQKAESNKWGWMLLAFIFGINGIILFYLNQVILILSAKTKD